MGYLAFVYSDHEDNGVQRNCRGYFDRIDDALEQIHGGRWDKNNLELLDLETYGFHKYEWKPLFEFKAEFINDENGHSIKDENWPHAPSFYKMRYFLKHRYKKDADWFEIFKPTNWKASVFGEHNPQYYAGEWCSIRN
jgi:hypothetical protein